MKKVKIYTDGSCIPNPGVGGWSAIIVDGNLVEEIYGKKSYTTNNEMELTAVIKGLEKLTESCEVDLYCDSSYVVYAFLQGRLTKWKSNGWKTSNRKPVKNKELWTYLDKLTYKHKVNFIKVEGHSDNDLNNKCDTLARYAIFN